MNELTTTGSAAPQITLEELTREERDLVEDGVLGLEEAQRGYLRLGRALCLLKARCHHGRFTAIVETFFDISESNRAIAMRVYREFGEGQILTRVKFSNAVWRRLAYAPNPQAALEEAQTRADAGETVTTKIAEEIAAAQKAQQEAEAKVQAVQLELVDMKRRAEAAEAQTKPDQSRLIRELALARKGGGISEAEAQAYSLLPEYLQRKIHETLRKSDLAAVDRQQAERTAAGAVAAQKAALDEAARARAEADEAKRRADEIAREGAQSVIDDLNARVETLKKQVERERETAWEEGKRAGIAQKDEAQAKNTADLEDRIAALEKEKNALSRKLSGAEGKLEAAWREARMEEARANGLQEQMEAAHPVAKDNIHSQVVAHMTEDLKATIAKLEADCETFQRKLTNAALETLAAVVNGYLRGQKEMLIEG